MIVRATSQTTPWVRNSCSTWSHRPPQRSQPAFERWRWSLPSDTVPNPRWIRGHCEGNHWSDGWGLSLGASL